MTTETSIPENPFTDEVAADDGSSLAKAIQEHLEEKLGCHAGGTSKDGKFTLMKAECLAACGQAPMVQIDDDYHENLTLEKLDRILESYRAGA